MKKILIVTGTRAEYGLLKKLIIKFQSDIDFETFVAVTGTHLSDKHGMTINIIKADGIKNIYPVDLNIEGDTPVDLSDGIGRGLNGFSRLLATLKPEMMIVLGDRYELLSAVLSATLANIPIAHIHGGESTVGVIDESVRHSITKMSHFHFCSHEVYKQRILRMGENPSHVWNVGAVGLDRIREMKFLSKDEINHKLGTTLAGSNVLCTFHPVTLDAKQSANEIDALINVLKKLVQEKKDVKVFVTLPNADTFSNHIRNKWNALIKEAPDKIFSYVNLGDHLYISLMKEVDLVLGNSSSGVLEAPFLHKAVVNIGRRQEGRLTSSHVLHANGNSKDLFKILEQALSSDFQQLCRDSTSIYGEGRSVDKIYKVLKGASLEGVVFKKFYDND
jgi:GDP/UDP-N,N'-diacetylbacillosamine 2-epimerase (hydrolysing)